VELFCSFCGWKKALAKLQKAGTEGGLRRPNDLKE